MAHGGEETESRATGLAINFGVEPASPHVSPRLSTEADWAPVHYKSRLLIELQHTQEEIALLARCHNARIASPGKQTSSPPQDININIDGSEYFADREPEDIYDGDESMLLVNNKHLRREIRRLLTHQRAKNRVKPSLLEALKQVFQSLYLLVDVLVTCHKFKCSLFILITSVMIFLMPPFKKDNPGECLFALDNRIPKITTIDIPHS